MAKPRVNPPWPWLPTDLFSASYLRGFRLSNGCAVSTELAYAKRAGVGPEFKLYRYRQNETVLRVSWSTLSVWLRKRRLKLIDLEGVGCAELTAYRYRAMRQKVILLVDGQ